MHITDALLCKILGQDKPFKISIIRWDITAGITNTGDAHTSKLSRLNVTYQKKSKIFNETFILKVPSAHPFYKAAINYGIYAREFQVYTEILEEMYKIDGGHIGPRLYYADSRNSLMLKDLSLSGYKLAEPRLQMNYDQCYLVFKKLAKFHALSVKLNQLSRIPPEMKQFTWLRRISDPQDMITTLLQDTCDFFFANVDSNLTRAFIHLKDTLITKSVQEVRSENFPYCVLNHGDCWSSNIMLKCDKYGNEKKIKFIGFQNSIWNSPAYDLLWFTTCSMQYEVFENYYDLLLQTYVRTLNKILERLHCDLYTLENLRRDLSSFHHYGILMLICALPEFICSHDDPLHYKNVIINGDTINFNNLTKAYSDELYLQLLAKWLKHYERNGHF